MHRPYQFPIEKFMVAGDNREIDDSKKYALMFGRMQGKTRPIEILYDSGAGPTVFDSSIPGIEMEGGIMNDQENYVAGIGGYQVATKWMGTFEISKQYIKTFKDKRFKNIIQYHEILSTDININVDSTGYSTIFEAHKHDFESALQRSLLGSKLSEGFAGKLDGLIGMIMSPFYPIPMITLANGLNLYHSRLKTHNDNYNLIIGGSYGAINQVVDEEGGPIPFAMHIHHYTDVINGRGPSVLTRDMIPLSWNKYSTGITHKDYEPTDHQDTFAAATKNG